MWRKRDEQPLISSDENTDDENVSDNQDDNGFLSDEELPHKSWVSGVEKLSQKSKDLDEEIFKKSKDLDDEELSRKPKDLGNEELSRKPKDLGDEELSRNQSNFHKHTKPSVQNLCFEDKVQNLRDKFKRIPISVIRNVLQRDDVEENLNVATSCLEVISASEGTCKVTSERVDVSGEIKRKNGFGKVNESRDDKAREHNDSRNFKDFHNLQTKQSLKEMSTTVSIDGPEESRPEALAANTLPACNKMKKRKPPVLPKKAKKGIKSNDDSGKRHRCTGSTGITHQNKTETDARPQGTRYVTKQRLEDNAKQSAKEVPKFEPNVISIRGLNKSTSYETIMNFVESKTKEQVLEIVKLEDETTALIKFKKLRDFENAKEKMESSSLDGEKVAVRRVPVCASILIRNLVSDTTRDALEHSFSNPLIGGEVTSIQYEEGMMSKSLKLNDAEDEVAVAVDKDVMEFISATNSLGELKKSLKVHGFTLKYASGDSFVYFAPTKCALDSSVDKIRGIKIVTDFNKKFKAIELDVDKNHWDAVIIGISKLHKEIGKEKMLVKECESSKEKVTIICREADAKELKKKFMDKIAEIQNLEAKKANETMTMDIEKEKLSLLIMTGYQEKIHSESVDLAFNIDEANGKVIITGPRQQCYEAKLKIYQELSNFCEKQMSFSKSVLEIMNFEEAISKRIKKQLLRQQIYAVFHIYEGNAFLIGINKKHADDAAVLVKSLMAEEKIKANEENIHIFKALKWIDLCNKVEQEFKVYVRINEDSDTWIVGSKEDVLSAQKTFKTFIDENSIGTETYCSSDKEIRRYIWEVQFAKLMKMTTDYSLSIRLKKKRL